jgi:hypothetical protein
MLGRARAKQVEPTGVPCWLLLPERRDGDGDSNVDPTVPAIRGSSKPCGCPKLGAVGARNSAYFMRPGDIRGSGRGVRYGAGRCRARLLCGWGIVALLPPAECWSTMRFLEGTRWRHVRSAVRMVRARARQLMSKSSGFASSRNRRIRSSSVSSTGPAGSPSSSRPLSIICMSAMAA